MKNVFSPLQCAVTILLLLVAEMWPANAQGRIAGFGSSVCNGAGDHSGAGGYIGRLGTILSPRGWTVLSVSRDGDNTATIHDRWQKSERIPMRPVTEAQYLLPRKPDFVVIGLSLANEGIRRPNRIGRDSVVTQFEAGLLSIIDRCRSLGITPVVGSCYPHQSYSADEYASLKAMNLIIHAWDIPSVNFLGTVDDGEGRWAAGFFHDEGHPNAGGHREMSCAIPPTLFDAIKRKKPAPVAPDTVAFAHAIGGSMPAFVHEVDDTVHAFSISLRIRAATGGTLLRLEGIPAQIDSFPLQSPSDPRYGRIIVPGTGPATAAVEIAGDRLIYRSIAGHFTSTLITRGDWHHVTVAHRPATGRTWTYVDGVCVAEVPERWMLRRVLFLDGIDADCDDIMFHRSALGPEEVRALHTGRLLRSSLEVYAPMDDPAFVTSAEVENRAQSLSRLIVRGNVLPAHRGTR
jgi:lysophospholipase L1-like esterase